jgi:hypothetical protein
MSIFYTQDVRYFEVSFTLPHAHSSRAAKGNLINELFAIIQDECEVDALVDANYGKGFEHIHFVIVFGHPDDWDWCSERVEAWAKEYNALDK